MFVLSIILSGVLSRRRKTRSGARIRLATTVVAPILLATFHAASVGQSLMEPGLWGVSQLTLALRVPGTALGGTAVACLSKKALDGDPYFLRGVAKPIEQANLSCGVPIESHTDNTATWRVAYRYNEGAGLDVTNVVSRTEVTSVAVTTHLSGAAPPGEQITYKYIGPCATKPSPAATVMEPGLWAVSMNMYEAANKDADFEKYAVVIRRLCRTKETIAIDPFFLEQALKENLELKGFTCDVPVETQGDRNASLRMKCEWKTGEHLEVSSLVTPHLAKVQYFHDRGINGHPTKEETTSTYLGACPASPGRLQG